MLPDKDYLPDSLGIAGRPSVRAQSHFLWRCRQERALHHAGRLLRRGRVLAGEGYDSQSSPLCVVDAHPVGGYGELKLGP